jgi:hypothetical protein
MQSIVGDLARIHVISLATRLSFLMRVVDRTEEAFLGRSRSMLDPGVLP